MKWLICFGASTLLAQTPGAHHPPVKVPPHQIIPPMIHHVAPAPVTLHVPPPTRPVHSAPRPVHVTPAAMPAPRMSLHTPARLSAFATPGVGRMAGVGSVPHPPTSTPPANNPRPSASANASQNNSGGGGGGGGPPDVTILPPSFPNYSPPTPPDPGSPPRKTDDPDNRPQRPNQSVKDDPPSLSTPRRDSGTANTFPARARRPHRETLLASLPNKLPDLDDDEDPSPGPDEINEIDEIGLPSEKLVGDSTRPGVALLKTKLKEWSSLGEEKIDPTVRDLFCVGSKEKPEAWREAYRWGMENVMEKLRAEGGKLWDCEKITPVQFLLTESNTVLLMGTLDKIGFGAVIHVGEPRYAWVEFRKDP